MVVYFIESKDTTGWWKLYAEGVHPTLSMHESFHAAFTEAMKLNPTTLAIKVGPNSWFEVPTNAGMITETAWWAKT